MKLYESEIAECQLGNLEWALALRLAQKYDWRPAGTDPPRHAGGAESSPEEDWNESYVAPRCQRMHAEDCDRLADALERGFLEAIYRQESFLNPEARDAWSALIAFLRTAASRRGLFLVADDESPDQEGSP